ncbi:MAG: AI-2E family transporter [Candidatus Riflebacteria bacterium]|nr:AI-2E family transporter [Candidatus Riflebacteria bacterium]
MSIKNLSPAVKNALIALGFIVAIVISYYLSSVIAPFLISLVIAYVVNPLVRSLVARKLPRPWAVLAVFFVCIIIFTIFIVPFGISMISEAGELVNKLANLDVKKLAENYKGLGLDLYQKLEGVPYIKTYVDEFVQSDRLRELASQGVILARDGAVALFKQGMSFLGGAFSGMFNMFLIPILVFYILLDIDAIFESFKMLLPPDYRERVLAIIGKIDEQLNALLRGQLFANSIFALMMVFAIWLSGLNFSLFLGLLAGIANFIPYLGGLFTIIFAVLVAITQFGFSSSLVAVLIKIAIAIAIIQTIDGWYLQPNVVGENAGLHPLIVMLALAIAANIAGIPGMLVAVPLTVILKVLGRELYHELYDPV